MSGDDWLFDGSGTPDEVQADLQRRLTGYRHDVRRRPTAVAGAAASTLLLGLVAVVALGTRGPVPWSLETATCSGCVWEVGSSLDTTQRAVAQVANRGELVASSGAVVRRLDGDGARLAVDAGRIDVWVDAEAEWLTVQLPGVELVDLGCAFSVDVDPQGHGVVQVATGAVGLRGSGPETVLPAGTMAATWPSGHTGLAVVHQADASFVARVDAFDRGGDWRPVLDAAELGDAITVWHLLDRVPDRASVVERLVELLGAGAVDRSGLVADDADAERDTLAFIIGRTL